MTDQERRLAALFAEHHAAEPAPPRFRVPERRRAAAPRRVLAAGAAALALTVGSLAVWRSWRPESGAAATVELAAALSEWEAPLDFLLAGNLAPRGGRDLLRVLATDLTMEATDDGPIDGPENGEAVR